MNGKKKKRRPHGEGGLIKRHKRYYLRKWIGDKRIELPLKNEDGSPCTTSDQGKDAASRMDRSVLELDSR